MPLTPLDIESRRFRRQLFGYRRSEVEQFLASVADALSQAVLEREDLARQLKAMREELEGFRQRERTLIEALSAAERIAEERKQAAQKEAERIIADARRHAERIIANTREEVIRVEQQIIRLKAEREGFESRLAALLNEHRRLMELRRQEGRGAEPPATGRSTMPPPHPTDPNHPR
ncbi:MAG: DivIVA domain-containing protein [Acidobacteria bacterium]|nr:MAG: DivIVA domain-containing protein [Acidobacteriota bacterium]